MSPSHAELPSVVSRVVKPLALARRPTPVVIPAGVMLLGVLIGWTLGVLLFARLG